MNKRFGGRFISPAPLFAGYFSRRRIFGAASHLRESLRVSPQLRSPVDWIDGRKSAPASGSSGDAWSLHRGNSAVRPDSAFSPSGNPAFVPSERRRPDPAGETRRNFGGLKLPFLRIISMQMGKDLRRHEGEKRDAETLFDWKGSSGPRLLRTTHPALTLNPRKS